MILYHSRAQISTAQAPGTGTGTAKHEQDSCSYSVHLLPVRFINALPPCAFVVNMSRTT
jgi:hypothetical protein